jgi:hypothetical protein
LNQTRAGGWDFSLKQTSIVKEHPAWRASYVERPSQEFYPWCNISKIPKHYSQLFQAQFDWFFKKCSFLPFENAIKPLAFILVSGLAAQPMSYFASPYFSLFKHIISDDYLYSIPFHGANYQSDDKNRR